MASVYRVNILEDKLKELYQTTPGIRGAVIVSVEGFVVAAYSPIERIGRTTFSATDMPQVAAMSATLFALGEQALVRLAQGTIERLMIEGASGAMIVYPINPDAALAAMVEKKAKMGLTLLAVARAAEELGSILSGVR
jgi:predicted regulator of Ras-like GTPase activity (Roadblock/LC7/MglB family)